MSKCPVCCEEYTIYGCQCLKVGEPVPLDGSITVRAGLEEIEKLESYFVGNIDSQGNCYGVKPRYRAGELAHDKINEIIERINLLTNFLIRRKNGKVKDGL